MATPELVILDVSFWIFRHLCCLLVQAAKLRVATTSRQPAGKLSLINNSSFLTLAVAGVIWDQQSRTPVAISLISQSAINYKPSCSSLAPRFGSFRIPRRLRRSQCLLFLRRADILFSMTCLHYLSTFVQFVCIAGARTLLLAFSSGRLVKLVAIFVHRFLPPVINGRPIRAESGPGSESVRFDSSLA